MIARIQFKMLRCVKILYLESIREYGKCVKLSESVLNFERVQKYEKLDIK
jgi:hypothetical protein